MTKKKLLLVGGGVVVAAWALSRYGRMKSRETLSAGGEFSALEVRELSDQMGFRAAIATGLRALGFSSINNNLGIG